MKARAPARRRFVARGFQRVAVGASLVHWLWLGSAQATLPPANASSRSGIERPLPNTSRQPLHLVVILVGDAAAEPTLFERIRTLLPGDARAELRVELRLRHDAVLQPHTSGVVYSWVTRSAPNAARVYLALRDDSEKDARFLFREVRLENGLDEVGIETLAQVTHSSAVALWGAAQQITRRELAAELEREAKPRASEPETKASLSPAAPASNQRRDAARVSSGAQFGARIWQIELGPQLAVHQSGSEGWLAYPGGVLGLTWNDRLALRGNFGILVPTDFNAETARVALSGYAGDLRLGFGTLGRNAMIWRTEAGLGAITMRWTASNGTASRPNADHRGYAVIAGAIGRAWSSTTIGVRLEAAVPFQKTTYEIETPTQNLVVGRSWLIWAGAVEMSFPLTRF
jgi:hypothetical protein